MRKGSRSRYFILYTVVFLTVSLAVFFSFLVYGKSFVCTVDGQSQYIVYLRYMGQYLRKTFLGFLHGDFHPAQFDFSIGIGDDIGAIVRFHPLDFLAAFVPAAYTEQIYAVILLLRFYLAGLAFSWYAFSMPHFTGFEEKEPAWQNVLSGSLVYVFCGFMLIRVTNHPTYAAPFIVLPLLFLGMERVVSKKDYLLFPAAVLLGFWSNYYFMYICSIALLVYALLRYPEIVKEKRIRRFPAYAGSLIGLYLVGLFMSMATFLPAMLRYRGSYRLSQTSRMQNLFVYGDKRRYVAWFLNLISPYQSSGNGLDLNFSVIVIPALAVLFTSAFRRLRTLRASLLLELIALLVPVFGYIFAGMNNENNRWMFLIAFSLGMCCVHTINCFADLEKKQLRSILILSGLFIGGVLAERVLTGGNRFNEAGAVQLFVFVILLLVFRRRKTDRSKVRGLVLLTVMASAAISGFMTYSPWGGDLQAAFQDRGDTTEKYEKLSRRIATELPDDGFYRVDAANVLHGLENSAEYFDYNSIGMYNSILNTSLIRTFMDEGNAGLDAITQVHDLDGRPVTENLAHVRYFIASRGNEGKIPYGFSKTPFLTSKDGKTSVYECENLLPAGFSSGTYISWENYQKLSDVEKEYVKLDGVVLPEDGSITKEQAEKAGLSEVTKPSAEIRSEELQVPAAGAKPAEKVRKISMTFTGHAGTVSYLRLKGLTAKESAARMVVRSDGLRTDITLRDSDNVYTLGREDYLICLGYNDEEKSRQVTLKIGGKGLRGLEGAELVSVSMEDYSEKVASLGQESLSDEKVTDGLLEGSISLKKAGLLVLPVAAQNGWKLYVDGQERKAAVLDGMYTGALLESGDHQIRLVYRTPGAAAGWLCTLAGILAFLFIYLSGRRKRSARKGNKR